jgi:ElaB/YqjD/DUF883 family membrane-anchored ribosome-binding protein
MVPARQPIARFRVHGGELSTLNSPFTMKHRNDVTAQKPEDLLNDLRTLVGEAEKMIGDSAGDHSDAALSSLRERFADAQERFSDLYAGARKKVIAGAKYTDATIREKPYQSLAVALGIGVLLGVIVGRRSR